MHNPAYLNSEDMTVIQISGFTDVDPFFSSWKLFLFVRLVSLCRGGLGLHNRIEFVLERSKAQH